jgi:hypothetical protein
MGLEDPEQGKEGLILEKTGKVTSNRMLMTFIKTTLQASYDKLVQEFLMALEKDVAAAKELEGNIVEEKVT